MRSNQSITRTVNNYRARAYRMYLNAGEPAFDNLGEVEFKATYTNKMVERKAFARAGIELPRGCEILCELVGATTYEISLDEFLAVAHVKEDTDAESADSTEGTSEEE